MSDPILSVADLRVSFTTTDSGDTSQVQAGESLVERFRVTVTSLPA